MSLLIYEVYRKGGTEDENESIRFFQNKDAADEYAHYLNDISHMTSFYSNANPYCVQPMEITDEVEMEFPVGVFMTMVIAEDEYHNVVIKRHLATCKSDFIYDDRMYYVQKAYIRLGVYKELPTLYHIKDETKITALVTVPCKQGDTLDDLSGKATIAGHRVLEYLQKEYDITYDMLHDADKQEERLLEVGFKKIPITERSCFYILEMTGSKEEE